MNWYKKAQYNPAPKFKLGDIVEIIDGNDVLGEGEVSFITGYDDFLGQWRYKVQTQLSRVNYSQLPTAKARGLAK